MNNDITYLMPKASDEILFNIAKESINRYMPARILTCGKDQTRHWGEAFMWLFNSCPTDIGVFIDDDAFILRDITPLIDLIRSEEYSIVGFTERLIGKHKEFQYYQPNFMILNIKKFKAEFGKDGINVDVPLARRELGMITNPEFMYGISQKLKGRKNKDLNFRLSEHYKLANLLSDGDIDYVLHLWYGAWRHRRDRDMSERDNLVSKDFWNNELKI